MDKKVVLPRLECLRCGYKWIPRQEHPYTCPKCKSAKWDVPKEEGGRKHS